MAQTRPCDYCGADIEPGTGTMFVAIDGSVTHFCSAKCEKNADLGRESRDLQWTESGRAAGAADRAAAEPAPTEEADREPEPDPETEPETESEPEPEPEMADDIEPADEPGAGADVEGESVADEDVDDEAADPDDDDATAVGDDEGARTEEEAEQ